MEVIHKKTLNEYLVIGTAKNCTNGLCDGQSMVLYEKDGKMFVREESEFWEKFYKKDEKIFP